MSDHPAPRASDADRDQTVAQLREAVAQGKLSLEEFTERMDDALRTVRVDELAALTSDLGALPVEARSPRRWVLGVFGGGSLRGRWRVGRAITIVDIFGGSDVDLRDAIVTEPEVSITAIAIFGGCDILVPDGADVRVSGGALFGGNDVEVHGAPVRGGPRITIRAFSLFGGIDVKDRRRRERRDRVLPPPAPPPPHQDERLG